MNLAVPYTCGVLSALSGFATIWAIAGVGWVLAHIGILDRSAQEALAKTSFRAGLPCLLFASMYRADLGRIFSFNVLASASAIVLTALIYVVVSRLIWKPNLGHAVIGTFASSYVNANNMGVPITLAVIGDSSWVAPVLLVQVLLLQPLGLSILDAQLVKKSGREVSKLSYLSLPFKNPMTIGVLLGILSNIVKIEYPSALLRTVEILGDFSVPAMLIAFGVSLRIGPIPGRQNAGETWFIATLKTVVMPLVAAFLSIFVFKLDSVTTLAVTVMAGLPCAQNVFVFAMRGKESVTMARDAIFITSFACIPVITIFATVLHAVY